MTLFKGRYWCFRGLLVAQMYIRIELRDACAWNGLNPRKELRGRVELVMQVVVLHS